MDPGDDMDELTARSLRLTEEIKRLLEEQQATTDQARRLLDELDRRYSDQSTDRA